MANSSDKSGSGKSQTPAQAKARAQEQAAAQSAEQSEAEVDHLARQIEQLRSDYDQYFLGINRQPPNNLRKQVDSKMMKIKVMQVKNTGLKFRIGSLEAKLLSYRRLWDRTLQQLEDGTFHRDRFRLKLYNQKLAEQDKSKQPAPPKSKEKESPADKSAGGNRNASIDSLLTQFVQAKQKCAEAVDGLSYEAFAKTITAQSTTLKQKYNCKTVKFKVVIEGGKAKLKATPT